MKGKRRALNILDQLAMKYQTDKYGSHWYTPHYHNHFRSRKNRQVNLLEIGVGGYDDIYAGGNSLRMWKEYFPHGNIYGVDLEKKIGLEEPRIKIFQGDQCDESFLTTVRNEMGRIDIIIDDGSHENSHVITSFQILFPFLVSGGIYVIEDIQTSYWPLYGGDSQDLNNRATSMNFVKSLTDSLNYQEIINPDKKPSYFDLNIISMHFYHNMVFIFKGENDEPSNLIQNNKINHGAA